MILIISTCKEKIHELEFVKPIENILKEQDIKFFTRYYKDLKKGDFSNAKKIIISGTSLKDNNFIKDVNYFRFIINLNKPILGICAGMQIIALTFSGRIKKKQEIGFYKENFTKEFLGLKGEQEVYHLHNNYVSLPREFLSFTLGKIPQSIKHKEKDIYGVLFHPEVKNKKLIENFIKL